MNQQQAYDHFYPEINQNGKVYKKYGLIYDEDEWAREWQSLLKLSSYQPRIQINTNSNNNNGK
jgi:hypothetical protein